MHMYACDMGEWRINAASREPTGQTVHLQLIGQSDHLDQDIRITILSGVNAAQETFHPAQ